MKYNELVKKYDIIKDRFAIAGDEVYVDSMEPYFFKVIWANGELIKIETGNGLNATLPKSQYRIVKKKEPTE